MFELSNTRTEQGNIGEACAIYKLTLKGYDVSRTIFDSSKYDLIIDDGLKLHKVQVKTTQYKNKRGRFEISLTTKGGNTRTNTIRLRRSTDYDYLFVLSADGVSWLIPAELIGTSGVVLGSKWDNYKI